MSPDGASAGLEPVALDTAGGRLAALRSRGPRPGAPRLLCLHGWLDAATSFAPLARELGDGVELVAIDLPGHGLSEHVDAGYGLLDTALAARRALLALGWERATVVGHSLGANVALWLAVAAPEAVEALVLIDGIGPPAETPDALPARLSRALADRLHPERFAPRDFADLDAAIDHRLRRAPMARASAALIMARQCAPVPDARPGPDGGGAPDDGPSAGRPVRWRFDPALRRANEAYRTEAQVLAVLGAVDCRVLAVLAEDGYPLARPETPDRLRTLGRADAVTLTGRHHLHMDDPAPVARAVRAFLGGGGARVPDAPTPDGPDRPGSPRSFESPGPR